MTPSVIEPATFRLVAQCLNAVAKMRRCVAICGPIRSRLCVEYKLNKRKRRILETEVLTSLSMAR
jgi:hypothetical protein